MNTHLHVLEAYTELHKVARSDFSERLLASNIDLFMTRFVQPRAGHLTLFYSMEWQDQCKDESYGHDIEASWLLCEAAAALGDEERLARVKASAVTLANAVLEDATDQHGALAYERREGETDRVRQRHWWPQAEAVVGFYNAYQLTGDVRFRETAARVWAFVKAHQIDRVHGEWFWLSSADAPARGPYKAGFWKGPYHNGRAMMEMMRRLAP
jgi:mannobiose 2-epimerase